MRFRSVMTRPCREDWPLALSECARRLI